MSRPQPKIVMTPEMEEKFESELLWCIQQLQDSLKTAKLSKKQTDSQRKSLNVLMGNSPVVRKRQTMRVLFGDYRAKMMEEEKKLSKANLKFIIEPMQPHTNSRCLKKRVPSKNTTESEEVTKNISNIKTENEEVTENLSNIKIGNDNAKEGDSKEFKFVPSDNNFRFNF